MSKKEFLKIGVQFQTHVVAPRDYVNVTQQALDFGVDSVFLWDHLVPFNGKEGDVAWESWSLLGSVAHLFRDRVESLGVLVSPLSIREPAVLARSAATIAQLGNGAFILGVGAGGFIWDDILTDAPQNTASRMKLFIHRLRILREEVTRMNEVLGIRISIWVGGGGERVTIPSALQYADGWSGFGPPADFAHKAQMFSGRDIELSVLLTPMSIDNDLDHYFDAGARHVIRSLRPNSQQSFDFAPIIQLLSERDQFMGSL
jgi:alkanesulfonate monooxygenase SsuD/methylene tetrahydromethanopterin reductase-like flavin-dependent oxidoreductase (luciferase family)